jgi:N-dimethylarginine dimethylaminohydrolase
MPQDVTTPTILMSSADFFEVTYEINEWMDADIPVDLPLAQLQWNELKRVIQEDAGACVEVVAGKQGLPDMIFTANAAVILGKRALLAHYRYVERQGEQPLMADWFNAHGYDVVEPPHQRFFEGAGDALRFGNFYIAGFHSRTEIETHNWLAVQSGLPVLSIKLENPKFYHIDVTLCPTDRGDLIVYPQAFRREDWDLICSIVPEEKRIIVSEEEANDFACNAVSVGEHLIMGSPAPKLTEALKHRGYTVHNVDMSEIKKAGGSAKCCTLRLN